MGNIEDLKIILRAEVDKAISDLKRASREGKTAGKDWDNISKSFQANIKNSLSLKNAYAQLTMQIAGGLAVYQLAIKTISAIVTTTKESVTAFGKAREEHGRLEAQIKATGGAAGFTADELESMATSLQSATKISENEVRSAQSAMLKFTAITGDEFKRAIGLSLDLSKTMGTDAASAAQTLGKAIEDPVEGFGALRKAGVILSDSQEELAKKFVSTGEKGKAVELILNEIESRVGGVAKAIGKEDPAGLKRLGVATSEAKEHFGELISKGLSPVINKLAELLEKSNNAKDSFNNLQAALRGEGSVDTISSALTNEKKNLAALKASLGGADIWAAEQINRAIAQSELRIITLQETLKRMGQSSVLNGKPTNTTGLSESDKKAAEHIQAVNNEIEKNIQAIKLRAAALGKETSNQDIINQYVSSYVKLIQDSNGLITAANPAAIKLLSTIRELQGADAGESFADYYIEKAGTVEGARYQAAYDSYLKKKALEELAKTEAANLADYYIEKAGTVEGARYQAAYDSYLKKKALEELAKTEAANLADYYIEKAGTVEGARYQAAYDSYLKQKELLEKEKKDREEFFKDLVDSAKNAAIGVLASGIYDAFSSIGEAMASGASSTEAFGAAMKQFFVSALQQTSMLALNAGLRLLVEGGVGMLPVAIGLLALGGVSAITAGAISASGQVRSIDYDQYIIDPVIEAETELGKMRVNLIEDQLEKERDLRDENLKKIEQQFDMEFSVLQDQWERGLISTQDYKSQAATLRENEATANTTANAPVKAAEDMLKQISDAKEQKLSVLSKEGKSLQDELNGMTGWQKFWSGRDEQLTAQLNAIDARIKATNAAQSLPEISAAKYGADFITTGPRLLKVGDNPGGRERVRVEPIGTPNRYGPSGEAIIIQINAPVYGVDDLYGKLEEAGKKLKRGGRSPIGVFG